MLNVLISESISSSLNLNSQLLRKYHLAPDNDLVRNIQPVWSPHQFRSEVINPNSIAWNRIACYAKKARATDWVTVVTQLNFPLRDLSQCYSESQTFRMLFLVLMMMMMIFVIVPSARIYCMWLCNICMYA